MMGKRFFLTDIILFFFLLVIGASEAAHLFGIFLHSPFSQCIVVFWLTMAAGTVLYALLLFWKNRRRREENRDKRSFSQPELLLAALVAVLFFSQAIFICRGTQLYLTGDMTVETVGSFLQTDALYQVNPMTGREYQGGIPTRLEVLCLPTLYGVLCEGTGLQPELLVWRIVPVFTLFLFYCAYSSLAQSLFPQERGRRLLFLVFAGLLVWVGSYRDGVDGFEILCSGWRGVVLRNTVLFPYLLSLCLRRRYLLALGCVLAELCIVWTLYGLGVCAAALVGLMLTALLCRRSRTEGGAAYD